MQVVLTLTFEILNLVMAITFLTLFIIRMVRIRRLSQTTRYLHLYPVYRSIFVAVFVLCSIAQIVLLLVLDPHKISAQYYSELYLILGTCINSVILVFELILMRLEILRQRPYSPVHRIYWIYLPVITLVRLIIQAVDQEQLQIGVYQLVLSAVIFADSLLLCLYSMFLKRQEIIEYEHRQLFQFDHLNISLEIDLVSNLRDFKQERPQGLEMLKVELHRDSTNDLRFRVYNENGELVAKNHASFEALGDFYTKCCKFDLITRLNFQERLNHNEVEEFFQEMLADWRNYEQFVLEFLGVPQEKRLAYEELLGSMRTQRSRSHNQQQDPYCLFFNITVFKVMQIRSHFQFFISASSVNSQIVKEFHKRYTQFEEFDRKLRSVQIREGASELKLKMPQLPEKYYLNMQESDVEDRRCHLELYLRRIVNDRTLLKRYRESREIILEFLGIRDLNITLSERQTPILPEVSFQPKSISKMIAKNNEPATYYSFVVNREGLPAGVICKRYTEFEELHKQLKRWMHNKQVEYHAVVLPPKKLKSLTEKDKQTRHKQLTAYLNILCRDVAQLEDLYDWRAFLGQEILLSQPTTVTKQSQSFVEMTEKSSRGSSSSMNSSRLGAMIDTLGDQPVRAI